MNILKEILQIAEENNSRDFLIDSFNDRRFTFEEVHNLSCGLSSILLKFGIKKGCRVCIIMNNSVELVLVYFSILYQGAIAVPINPLSHKSEINFIIDKTKPEAIIFSDTTVDIYQNLRVCKSSHRILFTTGKNIDTSVNNMTTISISDCNIKGLTFQPFKEVKSDDIFLVTFTSGTTAFPKGVVHSINSLFSNAKEFNKFTNINSDDRFYHILPMSYMAGILNLLISPFIAGGSVVIDREFNASTILKFWNAPIKYEVNTLWVTPTILSMLVKIDRDSRARYYCEYKIKRIFVGTAPLPIETKREFESKYGKTVSQSYGLSELLLLTVNLQNNREDSVGKSFKGIKIKIKDDQGCEKPPENEGEIFVKTEYKMLGYFNDSAQKLSKKSNDGWFPTGDLGFVAANGELIITGRKKDIIIKGGVNISPLMVEKVVNMHPGVDSSVAVGVPDEYYGEVVAIALKPKQDYSIPEMRASLFSFCKENLGVIQQPSYFVILEDFPATFTGKLQRGKLKEIIIKRIKDKEDKVITS